VAELFFFFFFFWRLIWLGWFRFGNFWVYLFIVQGLVFDIKFRGEKNSLRLTQLRKSRHGPRCQCWKSFQDHVKPAKRTWAWWSIKETVDRTIKLCHLLTWEGICISWALSLVNHGNQKLINTKKKVGIINVFFSIIKKN